MAEPISIKISVPLEESIDDQAPLLPQQQTLDKEDVL